MISKLSDPCKDDSRIRELASQLHAYKFDVLLDLVEREVAATSQIWCASQQIISNKLFLSILSMSCCSSAQLADVFPVKYTNAGGLVLISTLIVWIPIMIAPDPKSSSDKSKSRARNINNNDNNNITVFSRYRFRSQLLDWLIVAPTRTSDYCDDGKWQLLKCQHLMLAACFRRTMGRLTKVGRPPRFGARLTMEDRQHQ